MLFHVNVQLGRFIRVSSFALIVKRVKMGLRADINDAIGNNRRGINRCAQVCRADDFLFLRCSHDDEVAIFIANINFSVRNKRRAPNVRLHIVRPIKLAGLGVQAMDEPGKIADEQQAGIRIYSHRGKTAVNACRVRPDFRGLGHVTGLGGVNAGQVAHAFAVFGVLAHGHINAVLVEHWRRIDFTGTFRAGIFVGGVGAPAFGRVAIKFPDRLQKAVVACLDRLGIERVAETVAAAEENQLPAIYDTGRR